MPKDSVTLVLNGEVFLEDLAAAVKGWQRLMSAISHEESPRSEIHWVVDQLSTGSFFGTLRASPNGVPIEVIERSVWKYEAVGRGLRIGRLRDYSDDISSAAKEIAAVVGERVTSARFETDDTETEIYTPFIEEPQEPQGNKVITIPARSVESLPSFGAIRGRLHTVSDRGGLRFMLYEMNTDRAVTCYLDPEGSVDKEILRSDWGKMATVVGMVRRDPVTGHATTIRRVRSIQVIEPTPKGAWRKAMGIAPARTNETSEAAVRKVRDG